MLFPGLYYPASQTFNSTQAPSVRTGVNPLHSHYELVVLRSKVATQVLQVPSPSLQAAQFEGQLAHWFFLLRN
jgi:hypothetical protein